MPHPRATAGDAALRGAGGEAAGIDRSVGTIGDSYSLAKTIIGLSRPK